MFPDLTRDDVFRIETPRLWLRWPTIGDATAIAAIAGNRGVAEMTAHIPHPYPAGCAETFIFGCRKANALGDSLKLALVREAEPAAPIGMVAMNFATERDCDIGYMLEPALVGNGLMTEAVQALIDAAFTLTIARSVSTCVRVVHPDARRVLERSGFQARGSRLVDMPARGGRLPCDEYRLERRTWEALKSWRSPNVQRVAIDAGITMLEANIALETSMAARALDRGRFDQRLDADRVEARP